MNCDSTGHKCGSPETCGKCLTCYGSGRKFMSESDFEDYLNDTYPLVEICGIKYPAGYSLRQVDETAFRCAYLDYITEDCETCGGTGKR